MSKPNKSAKTEPRALTVQAKEGESGEAAVARLMIGPSLNSAMTVQNYLNFKNPATDVQLPDLVNELAEQCKAVSGGDLSRAKTLLIGQAHALDAIFTNLARRASVNFGEYLDSAEKYMRLALKAQSQSRATLETLAAIMNPPVVIARQANVTSGPQQVNNGIPLARENEIKPKELLERSNGKWLDGGAASQAIGSDKAMEPVGAIDGAKDGGG